MIYSILRIIVLMAKILIISSLSVLIFSVSMVSANCSTCDYNFQTGWMDCGGASWYNDNLFLDHNSLRSGPIENSGVSRICKSVKGPATISFRWKTDSDDSGVGCLYFLVNEGKKYECNSHEWKNESFELRNFSDYLLTWEYRKYKSYPRYSGVGRISDICIIAENEEINPKGYVEEKPSNYSTKLGPQSGHIYVNGHDDETNNTFDSIKKAIDLSQDGDTIIIAKGIYKEKLIVDKSLKLIGEDRNNSIINGDPSKLSAIYVNASDVIIQNLTIKSGETGIFIDNAKGCRLINNNISECTVSAIWINNSSNIFMQDNILSACGKSISDAYLRIDYTNYFSIVNNILCPNSVNGILLDNSNHGIISLNRMQKLNKAIYLFNDSGNNTIDESNNISHNNCDITNHKNLFDNPTCGKNIIYRGFKLC